MRTPWKLIVLSMAAGHIWAADDLLPSLPAIAVEQAQAGDVRLLVWELPGGGLEAQALDAASHETLSGRLTLGAPTGGTDEPRTNGIHARPAVAGLVNGGEAVFIIAWHAGMLDENGNGLGTEVIGQRVVVDGTGAASTGPLTRISRVDNDTDATAASEARSAPVVVANETEREFLVLWTHWPEGKVLTDFPPVTHDNLFIYGQELSVDGQPSGNSLQLDALTAPVVNGSPERGDADVIFLAAVPVENDAGYLLAWSDPAQEDGDEDLAQLYTRLLPDNLALNPPGIRNALGDSTDITEGTGRVALAPLPDRSGYLLAYEDRRGKAPVGGIVLDATGAATGDPFVLLDRMRSGDHAFLSPRLASLPQQQRLVLHAAVGDRSIDGTTPVHAVALENGRLVRRVLDPDALPFSPFVDDFETLADAYPAVTLYFATHAHAVAALPDESGDVAFTIMPDEARIVLIERTFQPAAPPAPQEPAPPASPPDTSSGGGAILALLAALCLLTVRRKQRLSVPALLLGLSATAHAAPPDVELLYNDDNGASCYRVVMYREVAELQLGARWGQTPVPATPAIEIVDLPAGWRAENVVKADHQYLRLHPAAFDIAAGFSIGRICVRFPPMRAEPRALPYTYELAATDGRISASTRADDGLSDDQLRALAKRGERLEKTGDLDAPKEIEEAGKAARRLKGLFD